MMQRLRMHWFLGFMKNYVFMWFICDYKWKYDKCVGMHRFLGFSIGRCSLRMDYGLSCFLVTCYPHLWIILLSSFILLRFEHWEMQPQDGLWIILLSSSFIFLHPIGELSSLSSFIFPLIWHIFAIFLRPIGELQVMDCEGSCDWKIFPKRALSAFEGSVVSLSPLQLSFLYQIRTNSFDATHE